MQEQPIYNGKEIRFEFMDDLLFVCLSDIKAVFNHLDIESIPNNKTVSETIMLISDYFGKNASDMVVGINGEFWAQCIIASKISESLGENFDNWLKSNINLLNDTSKVIKFDGDKLMIGSRIFLDYCKAITDIGLEFKQKGLDLSSRQNTSEFIVFEGITYVSFDYVQYLSSKNTTKLYRSKFSKNNKTMKQIQTPMNGFFTEKQMRGEQD